MSPVRDKDAGSMTTCPFGPSECIPRDFPRSSSGASTTAEMLVSDENSKGVPLWKSWERTPEVTIYTILYHSE